MRPSNHFRALYAAGALVLVLPLVGTGCKKGGDAAGGKGGGMPGMGGGMPGAGGGMPGAGGGMPGAGGGMPGAGGGMPGAGGGMPGAGGGMPGMGGGGGMPGMGGGGMPGMGGGGGMPGMGGGGGMPGMGGGGMMGGGATGAVPGASVVEESKVSFRGMKFVSPPKERPITQPDGRKARHMQFHYQAKGDPEALLPFLNPAAGASLDESSIWFVSLPKQATIGKKTAGEWENLFCTFVVADSAAIAQASEALQSRLVQVRRKLYQRRVYTVDVLNGESLPQTARAHTQDAMAAGVGDAYTRMNTYLDMTREALRSRRVDQAKAYLTAAKAALADLSVDNQHTADALWLYRNGAGGAR